MFALAKRCCPEGSPIGAKSRRSATRLLKCQNMQKEVGCSNCHGFGQLPGDQEDGEV